jgi:hypothetical protein
MHSNNLSVITPPKNSIDHIFNDILQEYTVINHKTFIDKIKNENEYIYMF